MQEWPDRACVGEALAMAQPLLYHPFSPAIRRRAEDYHWWWRAYLTSGSSALYLFLYSLFYFYTKLDITKLVPALMYFGELSNELWMCGGGCTRPTTRACFVSTVQAT